MEEHTHGCLKCRPEMVPDFDRDDARYHHHDKCGRLIKVVLDGAVVQYTTGVFEGSDGWALVAGESQGDVHVCSADPDTVCVSPRFGTVEVVHECPAIVAEQRRQVDAHVAEMRRLAGWRSSEWSWVGEQGPELIRPGGEAWVRGHGTEPPRPQDAS